MLFARFMELALYHPEHGYYERAPSVVGKAGDFITSASVGPVFGELLARQFQTWAEGMEHPIVLECGAHDGRLAGDILSQLVQAGQPAVEYWIVEPSPARRAWQERTLGDHVSRVRWFAREEDLPPFEGIVFANELLDALPRQRLGWDAALSEWFEWGVEWGEDRFAWVRLAHPWASAQPPTPEGEPATGAARLLALPPELLALLPDGFSLELCPAASRWWASMAERLREGVLMTIDYGLEWEDFFHPGRAQGTLRSYRQHRLVADVLADPGEQDITGMVDFSELRRIGEQSGLATIEDTTQARFLSRVFQASLASNASTWSAGKIRQFQTLIHPEHLGGPFRVLAQRRKRRA